MLDLVYLFAKRECFAQRRKTGSVGRFCFPIGRIDKLAPAQYQCAIYFVESGSRQSKATWDDSSGREEIEGRPPLAPLAPMAVRRPSNHQAMTGFHSTTCFSRGCMFLAVPHQKTGMSCSLRIAGVDNYWKWLDVDVCVGQVAASQIVFDQQINELLLQQLTHH